MYLPRSPNEGMGGRPPSSSSSSAQLTGAGGVFFEVGTAIEMEGMELERRFELLDD